MTPLYRLLRMILLLPLLSACPALMAAEVPVIAAASDAKFALQDIAEAFRQDTGKSVRISYGSSGNLFRQIQQGAPFELFLSADKRYIEQLQQLQLATDKSVIYALGRLVLLTAQNSPLNLDEQLQDLNLALQDGRLQRFAIANPEHAPYGVAAREVLQHQGLWPRIQAHLVMGENVAQAAQFGSSGAAQGALVSYSLALAPDLKDKIRFVLIPQSFHRPLKQAMALLNPAGDTATLFYHYLQQDKARKILSDYGYILP